MNFYNEVGFFDGIKKPLVIVPVFTASAYSSNGFYDYYEGRCGKECLTVKIKQDEFDYSSSSNGIQVLKLLGYELVTDIDVDKNPDLIFNYEKIIVLHNEYVTENMFKAITNHPNVIFLYPNALYAKISVDYQNDTITLIRGHGYPEKDIKNGFSWKNDNTRPYEFDTKCENWKFYKIDNGWMLNCYPENLIWKDKVLLKTLKEI